MNESMKELKNKFEKIKEKGYIKSSRHGSTGIGKTFEDLIGKKEDQKSEPDFKGIEIKTKDETASNKYITLFNATPKGYHDYEIQYLTDRYGYPDRLYHNVKVMNRSIYANRLIGNRELFTLKVDYRLMILKLKVVNTYLETLEDNIYWTFYDLQNNLYRKHRYLAIVSGESKYIHGNMHYKYNDIKFYKIKNVEEIIRLIENATIRVTFHVGVYRSGRRKGQRHDRGTAFQIKECDILKLFDEI